MDEISITSLGTVSPYPTKNKNCSGYLIKYGDRKILLDCGHGASSLMNFPEDLINLDIIISHLHVDHYADILAIAQTAYVYKRLGFINNDINIYLPGNDQIDYSYYEDNGWDDIEKKYSKKHTLPYEYIKSFEEFCPIKIHDIKEIEEEDLQIKFLRVSHPIETYASRIYTPFGDIVYSADTGTDNKLREFASNCDLFICESTFLRGQCRAENNHLFAYEAAEIAKDANVKKLLLTHFWPELDKELYVNEAKSIFKNTEAAIEGKKLVLRRTYE